MPFLRNLQFNRVLALIAVIRATYRLLNLDIPRDLGKFTFLNMKRITIMLAILLIFACTFSSCFIFKPKNKCDTCPSFGKKH